MIESFCTGATGDKIDPISAAESIKAVIYVSYKVWIQRHAFSPAQIVDGTADDYTECTPDKPLPPVMLSSDWTFDWFKREAVKSVDPWPPLDMGAMILELNWSGLILWHCHIEGSPTFGAGKRYIATDTESFRRFATAAGFSHDKKATIKMRMIPPAVSVSTVSPFTC